MYGYGRGEEWHRQNVEEGKAALAEEQALEADRENDEPEDDGPAGDYLADYWFNAEGPDEPADYDDV